MHGDVERVSAEIGYWLGEPFWGRGITSAALRAVTVYAMETHGLTRDFGDFRAVDAIELRVERARSTASSARTGPANRPR